LGTFIDIFYWDWIVLDPARENTLTVEIELCTKFFPCSLVIYGEQNNILLVDAMGSFECVASNGCSIIKMALLQLNCVRNVPSLKPVIEMNGGSLDMEISSFSGCI